MRATKKPPGAIAPPVQGAPAEAATEPVGDHADHLSDLDALVPDDHGVTTAEAAATTLARLANENETTGVYSGPLASLAKVLPWRWG
jgi:hypothetical protein